MMKFKILIISFAISCFLFSSDSALAIGIGAKPSFLDIELRKDQPKEVKILVYNISQEAGIFQVFPDELDNWIKITPDNFRLEAGENKEVKIKILAKEEGKKATNLSILANPLDRRSFGVGPGLKIPLRLNVTKERQVFLASLFEALRQNSASVLIGILVIFLLGFFLIRFLNKRRKFVPPPENLPIEKL